MLIIRSLHQPFAAEATGVAAQPQEQAGMTTEVIQKLLAKAQVLTQERKRRGKMVPEDLATQENVKVFRTLASHPVRLFNLPVEIV